MPTDSAIVFITGATDGIGKALAIHYLQHGYRERPVQLIMVGRKALADLDPEFYSDDNYCRVDLADPQCAQKVVGWLDEYRIEHIDLLIHNAGAGYVGLPELQSPQSIDDLLRVNLQSPLAMTHGLRSRIVDGGKVVFVSSVASVLPTPEYAVYSASKAAIDGLARNLRTEFNAPQSALHVEVQLILPGATKTRMHEKSGADLQAMKWDSFPSAESIAEKIRIAIDGRNFINPIGWTNRAVRFAGQHFESVISWLMARQFQKSYPDHSVTHLQIACNEIAPHAVVTGAADGIGKALTKRLLSQGYHVTGIDFDEAKAAETQLTLDNSGEKLRFIFGDLSQLEDLARIESALVDGAPIDLMVHNAGISAIGHFANLELNPQQRVIDVNLRAPMILTAGLLRNRLIQPGGTLIFMSSLSFYAGYPGAAVYGASKDGLASYARSLGAGLALDGINVLTVFPGPTRTAHARRYSPDNLREEKRMSPDELAARILNAVDRRKERLVPGRINQLSAVVGKFFPRVMDFAMRKVILDKLSPPPVNQ